MPDWIPRFRVLVNGIPNGDYAIMLSAVNDAHKRSDEDPDASVCVIDIETKEILLTI